MLYFFSFFAEATSLNICNKQKSQYNEECHSIDEILRMGEKIDNIYLLDSEYSPEETKKLIVEIAEHSKSLVISGIPTKLNFSTIDRNLHFNSITFRSLVISNLHTSFTATNATLEYCDLIDSIFYNGLFYGNEQTVVCSHLNFKNNIGMLLNISNSQIKLNNIYIKNHKSNYPLYQGYSSDFQLSYFEICNSSVYSMFLLNKGSLITQNIKLNQLTAESAIIKSNYTQVSLVLYQISEIQSNSAIVFADCSNLNDFLLIDMNANHIIQNYPSVFTTTNAKNIYISEVKFSNTTCRFGLFNNSELDMANCKFSDNILFTKRNSEQFSMISCCYCSGKIRRCEFQNNQVPSCIMLVNSTINTRENKISRNNGYKGTCYFLLNSNVSIILNEFSNNTANEGGALYAFHSQLRIVDSLFMNNSGNKGGDIMLVGFISAHFIGITSYLSRSEEGEFVNTNGNGKIILEGCSLNYTNNGINKDNKVIVETKIRRKKLERMNATENIVGFGDEFNGDDSNPTLHDLILILVSFGLITAIIFFIISRKLKHDRMKRIIRRKTYKSV